MSYKKVTQLYTESIFLFSYSDKSYLSRFNQSNFNNLMGERIIKGVPQLKGKIYFIVKIFENDEGKI